MMGMRAGLPVAVAALLLSGPSPVARPADRVSVPPLLAAHVVHYAAPVPEPLRVIRPFVAPRTRYGSGHRGVDLATTDGEVVRSAGAGVVTFAGSVVGRGVVVVAHADGVSTEYEPVTPSVRAGATVIGGQPLGAVHGTHGTCVAGGCLHWGARRGDTYLDPLALLRPLGVVRLLPVDGR